MGDKSNMEQQDNYKTTYIVRIYKNDNVEPHGIVGVIERIGKEEKQVFLTVEDLFRILIEKKKRY